MTTPILPRHRRHVRGPGPGPRAAAFYAAGLGVALSLLVLVQACTTRTVTGVPVGSVDVTPTAASVVVGDEMRFSATVRHEDGTVISGAAVSWSGRYFIGSTKPLSS